MQNKSDVRMSTEEEIRNYQSLSKSLDELTARFLRETGKLPSDTTVVELMNWVNEKIKSTESAWSQ
jgi:hypothetical protein